MPAVQAVDRVAIRADGREVIRELFHLSDLAKRCARRPADPSQ